MKKIYFLLIVALSFFLMPAVTFACESNSSKHATSKETSSKTDKDGCCKDDTHSKNKNQEGCDGKCSHSKCGCASSCNSSFSISGWNLNNTVFNFSYEKQNFYNSKTFISSGFYSLWLIPKIS
jgi:hypothetical protein